MKDVKTLIECLEGCISGRCSFCHKECQYKTNDKPIMTCEGLLKDVIECLKEKEQKPKEQSEYYVGQTLYIPGNPDIALLEEDKAFPVRVLEIKLGGEHNTLSEIRIYCNINRENYSIWRDDYVSVKGEGKKFFKSKEEAYQAYLEKCKQMNESTAKRGE